LTERYVDECVAFIREHRNGPFFLYLAHMYVHLPLYVPWRFMKETANGPYGGAVACVDWSVGVLMHTLRRLGLDENTLVIFTSDNGSRGDRGGSNRPLRGGKFTTWEGGLRLPCIMRWPGVIPAGTTCSELAASMDFLPTLAALAGAEPPGDRVIDGRDISPLLRGEPGARSPHDAFFYYLKDDLEAVRSGPWKLHLSRNGAPVRELYHLGDDIGEQRNIAADHPEVVRMLEAKASAMRDDLGDAATGAPGWNCRPPGRVENPEPLTRYDPEHPYMMAAYDLPDRG
jgi:arylsulfatase A-like enzyme